MGFSVTGVSTVSDVRDGISPPTILLTNENHTFIANSDGSIMDFTGFSTEVLVLIGADDLTYTNGTPTAGQFTIGTATVVPSNANLLVNVNSVTGVITISDNAGLTTGFAHGNLINSATISIPVTVFGFDNPFNRVISITKAIGGSAPFVRVASNTQTVEYDQDGMLVRSANIEIEAQDINFEDPGTITFTYRSGTTGSFVALPTTMGITITPITRATTDVPEVASIPPAAFNTLLGTNRVITFRATRGTVFDQITVARVNDGEAAVDVRIVPQSGSFILRQANQDVVLRADVYRSGNIVTPITSGAQTWTYLWSRGDTVLTSANQMSQTGSTQNSGEGFNQRLLRVNSDGITDGEAATFTCLVTEPEV